MKKIKIQNTCLYSMVDDDDYSKINNYKWFLQNGRYVKRSVPRRDGRRGTETILMHRQIMGNSKQWIDHKNGDGLDNRKENLRYCTQSQNCMNARKKSSNKSGHIGVHWDKKRNKWKAEIKVYYKNKYLGRFARIKDALNARKEAEIILFGEFRKTP